MTGKQLRAALLKIGFRREIGDYVAVDAAAFAKAIGRRGNHRTVNRWLAGKHATPPEVELLVDLLAAGKITLGDLR